MKISELVNILNQAKELNGDMDVAIITNASIYDEIEINCPNIDAPLYIEGYQE